jgi:glycosyltransferase involved in cell wall biosynthesis
MKILLVHNFYQQPGGEDQVFLREGNLLEEMGNEVLRYTVHNRDIGNRGRLALFRKALWNQTVYQELRNLIRSDRPDVVHFHNIFPLVSPSAYYAANAEGVPVVQTLHNYRLLCPSATFYRTRSPCEACTRTMIPWPGVIHRCYKESFALSGAVAAMLVVHRLLRTWKSKVTSYVVMTEFAREKFIDSGIPAQKIKVKSHFLGIDPGPGPGTGHYAIFVGRLSKEKGISTLLEAWSLLKRTIPLKIIGDGPLAPAVADAARWNSSISWLGRKEPAEIYDLVGNATCLVFPSELYETFGLVIIESFSKGTPVIASQIGAASELIVDGQTGLHFMPGTAADLAEKVRWLLDHPVQGAAMRWRARKEFEEKYSATRNYDSLMDIYRQVTAGIKNQLLV